MQHANKHIITTEELLAKNSGQTASSWDIDELVRLANEIARMKDEADKDWYGNIGSERA